jgi:hypothetical protein
MLQGAINHSQKCHYVVAPNFLQGVNCATQQCHLAGRPHQFYLEPERKCRNVKDVPLQGRGQEQRSEMSIHPRLSHQFYLEPS